MINAKKSKGTSEQNHKPVLLFKEKPLVSLVAELLQDRNAVILADSHNFPKVCGLGKTILVENNDVGQLVPIKREIKQEEISAVISVGGCTVLDIARAAAESQELIAVPTILSTACISVDKAVIKINGKNTLIDTPSPDQTIVSIPVIMDTEPDKLVKWSQSGFGDVFARFGASIDRAYIEGRLSLDEIIHQVPDCFDALNWVIEKFERFDEETLRKLAILSHGTSLKVIDGERGGGCEHDLYYKMVEQQEDYTRERPTHGQLVAVGTILAARILGEMIADLKLYGMLREAYRKLGLPLTFKELENIGITQKHLIDGLDAVVSEEMKKEEKGILGAGDPMVNAHSVVKSIFCNFSNLLE